jgi:hypothetical protein
MSFPRYRKSLIRQIYDDPTEANGLGKNISPHLNNTLREMTKGDIGIHNKL